MELRTALLLVSCCAHLACGSESGGTSESALTEFDSAGIDVRVLQVWTPGRIVPTPNGSPSSTDVAFDASSKCSTVSTNNRPGYEERSVDCSSTFASLVPLDGSSQAPPVAGALAFTVTKDVNTGRVYVDPDSCSRIEVRLVAREAALNEASFSGVGFWTSRGSTFARKSDLQEVGRVRLANGESGVVLRFAGASVCVSSQHGSPTSNTYQTFAFKPYAAYDVQSAGETHRYRVWEKMQGNHLLGRTAPGVSPMVDSTGFDRQADLLER